jgi:transcription initiation factor TFIID TATA-box-binding protein
MHEVEESIRIVATQIKKSGEKINMHPKIEVQNIVATSDLGCEINLNSIAVTLGLDRVEYEPEQFPGLVYRLDEPRVVLLLFGSGKMVCTGARRPSDIQLAVQKTRKELLGAGLLDGVRDRPVPELNRAANKPRGANPPVAPPKSGGRVPSSEASLPSTALTA